MNYYPYYEFEDDNQVTYVRNTREEPYQGSHEQGGGAPGAGGHMTTRAKLEIQGEIRDMSRNWSNEEWTKRRRLVQFKRIQQDSVIKVEFMPLAFEDYEPGMACVSCIYWDQKGECVITSVDAIYLLEQLVNCKFTIEEKNRIRRNLEGYHPLTVSKQKPSSEDFFKLIMGFPQPKPRNIEKDVKVFPWKTLGLALRKIISKYSATFGTPSHHHYPISKTQVQGIHQQQVQAQQQHAQQSQQAQVQAQQGQQPSQSPAYIRHSQPTPPHLPVYSQYQLTSGSGSPPNLPPVMPRQMPYYVQPGQPPLQTQLPVPQPQTPSSPPSNPYRINAYDGTSSSAVPGVSAPGAPSVGATAPLPSSAAPVPGAPVAPGAPPGAPIQQPFPNPPINGMTNHNLPVPQMYYR
ncbi:hypothetical protein B0I73DRAFT_128759 [Yarrowia lipolytica]|nr:hypothetical protein B0I73DRAFT_128759 [Yarrowia lipolytica]